MKFAFVTCVELGLRCMERIHADGGKLDLVITLPDDRARTKSGRVYVDDFCAAYNIPLLKTGHVNDDAVVTEVIQKEIDWLFIIGWSQIANSRVLDAPKKGVLGIHPTLLPIGRGRAAIPWAILNQLTETGVTLFQMDEGVDTGPILAQRIIPLASNVTATQLYEAVNAAHADLIGEVFPKLEAELLKPQEQDHNRATVWPGRKPEDGEIDLAGSVHDAERLVRAVTRPYPGAFIISDQKMIKIWRAQITDKDVSKSQNQVQFRDGNLLIEDFEIFDVTAHSPVTGIRT